MSHLHIITSLVLYQHSLVDIQTTLDSLIRTDSIDKIILVDNGGCDWGDHLSHAKIHYIKAEKNGGFGYGHNLAIHEYARLSDYFLICNPDIDFEPEQLKKLLEVASDRRQAFIFT